MCFSPHEFAQFAFEDYVLWAMLECEAVHTERAISPLIYRRRLVLFLAVKVAERWVS